MFAGFLDEMGLRADMDDIYGTMFSAALSGEPDAGGLVLFNYLAGEPITGLTEGRPLLARAPEKELSFRNLMRAQLYSALATLKLGMDILAQENVTVDRLLGHGGFFKTPAAGQQIMAAAAGAPVSVMETAGEGGPWGMALLCEYMLRRDEGQSLEDYLEARVFAGQRAVTVSPRAEDAAGFEKFMQAYTRALAVEKAAAEHIGA
jgi:sugar (pentulose or hexulose) kinase